MASYDDDDWPEGFDKLPEHVRLRMQAVSLAAQLLSTLQPRWSVEEATAEVFALAETILDDLYGGRENRLAAMPYDEYLRSPEWKARRRVAYERAGRRCQLCNADGEIHAHHRTYAKRGREEEADDLIVLCRRCHGRVHEFIWKVE